MVNDAFEADNIKNNVSNTTYAKILHCKPSVKIRHYNPHMLESGIINWRFPSRALQTNIWRRFYKPIFEEGFTHQTRLMVGWFVVFNATFNKISVISWLSVLLVKETGRPGENHLPVASHWQTSTWCCVAWVGFELTKLVVIGTDRIGSCKSKYHTITTAQGAHWIY